MALLAPSSSWSPAGLVLVLFAIALFSYFGAVAVQASALLDAGFVAALVAVAFLGPLPAACIWIGTEVAAAVIERVRLGAWLANVSSFGWAALAGGLVLSALGVAPLEASSGPADYAALALAGLVMLIVNFVVTRTLVAVVRDGVGFSTIIRTELVGHAPATVSMVAVGTVTALAYAHVGTLALGLFAAVVMVPQLLLPALLRPRSVAELDHTEAVSIYAQAIGRALRLSSAERLVLRDAAAYMRDEPLRPRSGDLSAFEAGHRVALVEAVLFHGEHWDGKDGTPGAVGGEMIPLTSRVLAVADAWAGLTAAASPRLTHAQALNQLEARAGMHFDPKIVLAAERVVARQLNGLADEAAYQPSVSRVSAPAIARKLGARMWEGTPAGASTAA